MRRRGPRTGVTVLVHFVLLSLASFASAVAGDDTTREVGRWNLERGHDDLETPSSKLTQAIGSPGWTPSGVRFDGKSVQGLLYGAGTSGELRLPQDFTLWVRAAFGPPLDRPLANHDTLVSRWGPRGSFSILLRSDHSTGTLRLFLSPDGDNFNTYDSCYRVDRSGAFHDLAVAVKAGGSVTFYIDGRKWCVLRDPPVPSSIHDPEGDVAPFAIGYNHDPAPGGDHETMNGTIAAVRVFRHAVSAGQIATLSGLSAAEPERDEVLVTVDMNDLIGQVSLAILGQFIEHFPRQVYGGLYDECSPHSDASGFRLDVLAALQQLRPPVLRWPGGNYTSAYHWRWGAVPKKYRPTVYDPVWGQTEPHTFGTPEFVELCRRIGATPLICVGVGRDPRCPTPKEAAAWVRYCNATTGPEAELRAEAGWPRPFDVLLWGLGNEVYGSWQVGCYRDPVRYAEDALQYARAMRQADPRIRFVVCGNDPDWNRAVLTDDVGRNVDWISFHDYFHMGCAGPRRPHAAAAHHLREVEARIEELACVNQEVSRRLGRASPITLAVDEWNEFGWAEKERAPENDRPEPYDLAHALYTAGFLNILLRHAAAVTMANYSPIVNCRGMLYADARGIVRRPDYHVFRMYAHCARATAVCAHVQAPLLEGSAAPLLDVAAVRGDDGSLYLYVVNLDPEQAIQSSIKLKGFRATRATGQVLTAQSLAAYNDLNHPDAVIPQALAPRAAGDSLRFEFAARSLTVLQLSP